MKRGKQTIVATIACYGVMAGFALPVFANPALSQDPIARGRYLVKISGCNDCHTAGYGMNNGKIPESQWLMGDQLGWQGPWGTTYASNLRLLFSKMNEEAWVKMAHTAQYRPPMPWFTLHEMKEQDLRDMYRFIRSLGPAGSPAPDYVPPGKQPKGPVVLFPAPPQ